MPEKLAPGQIPPPGVTSPYPVTVEVKVRLQALAFLESDGGYSIVVPALPGCVSQADSIEDVQTNVVEAAEGWLATGHDRAKEAAIRMVVE